MRIRMCCACSVLLVRLHYENVVQTVCELVMQANCCWKRFAVQQVTDDSAATWPWLQPPAPPL